MEVASPSPATRLPDAAALPEGFVDEEDYKVPFLDVHRHHPTYSGGRRDISETLQPHADELKEGIMKDQRYCLGSLKLDENKNLEGQKHECLYQLKENETLRCKLENLFDQFALLEQQFAQEKMLELKLEDPKIQWQQEKSANEQTQLSQHFDKTSLTEVLEKENKFLQRKYQESHTIIVQLLEERESMKKQLEKVKDQMERLEAMCQTLQAERKQNNKDDSSTGNS